MLGLMNGMITKLGRVRTFTLRAFTPLPFLCRLSFSLRDAEENE